MALPQLEQVFQISGVPTHTFVEPKEYTKLLVSLRTPGRGVVVEGPSGIGKTSAVETALKAIGAAGVATKLSARKPQDIPYIEALPTMLTDPLIHADGTQGPGGDLPFALGGLAAPKLVPPALDPVGPGLRLIPGGAGASTPLLLTPIAELSPWLVGGAVVVAGAAGVGIGYAARKLSGGWIDDQMQRFFDWTLGDADTAYARARGVEDNAPPHLQDRRQVEYERAKDFCNSKGTALEDPCADLNRKIEHAKKCIELYQAWDARWNPGRHDDKLNSYWNRLDNLKDQHNRECTEPWHR